MKKLVFKLVFAFAMLIPFVLFSQVEKDLYWSEFEFSEGVYLTYEEFKSNNPSATKFRVEVSNSVRRDDIKNGASIKWVEYKDKKGYQIVLKEKDMWGLCYRKEIYVYTEKALQRIRIIGAIMLLDIVYNTENIMTSSGMGSISSTDSQYIVTKMIDFETGIFYRFNLKNFEKLLSADAELYKEFDELHDNLKKNNMISYLNKFNSRNPIYFNIIPDHQIK